jgi:hypothetical protein
MSENFDLADVWQSPLICVGGRCKSKTDLEARVNRDCEECRATRFINVSCEVCNMRNFNGVRKLLFVYLFQFLGQELMSLSPLQNHPTSLHFSNLFSSKEYLNFPSSSHILTHINYLWSKLNIDLCLNGTKNALMKQLKSSFHSKPLKLTPLKFSSPLHPNSNPTFGDFLNANQKPIDISHRRENKFTKHVKKTHMFLKV